MQVGAESDDAAVGLIMANIRSQLEKEVGQVKAGNSLELIGGTSTSCSTLEVSRPAQQKFIPIVSKQRRHSPWHKKRTLPAPLHLAVYAERSQWCG